MNLDQPLHVLRAASDIGEKSFVLVGSQAVLLALRNPDALLTRSDELDLYPSMAPETAICPELHDLCVSKCVAGRQKAAEFVSTLFCGGHIAPDTLTERIRQIDAVKYPVENIVMWAERRHLEAAEVRP